MDISSNISNPSIGRIAYYTPDVVSYSDYLPFGQVMPNRHSQQDYDYGFQGQERDDELKGEGNSVNFEYRMHDPRIGRFLSIDPLTAKYPFYSPYSFSGNRVIDCTELEGLEPEDAKKGAKILVVVVLGYDQYIPPKKGETQFKNNSKIKDRDTYDYSPGSTKEGLVSVEDGLSDLTKLNYTQVVIFNSTDVDALTLSDVEKTMQNFKDVNPNGQIVLVGHSLGADIVSNAARNNPDIPIELMYLLDLAEILGNWEDDNISSNVKKVVNVYQSSYGFGGEKIEVDDDKKTEVIQHQAKDKNISHTNIDNKYTYRVIERIRQIVFKAISNECPENKTNTNNG